MSENKFQKKVDLPKYIGITRFTIKAINPSNEEKKALKIPVENDAIEPEYVKDVDYTDETGATKQCKQLMLRVYLVQENCKHLTSVTLFMKSYQSGFKYNEVYKYGFVNNQNRIIFGETLDLAKQETIDFCNSKGYKSPDLKSFRLLYNGEENLVTFVKTAFSTGNFEKEDVEKLFNNDFTPLEVLNNTEYKGLFGIDDKGYLQLYMGVIVTPNASIKPIHDALKKLKKPLKMRYPLNLLSMTVSDYEKKLEEEKAKIDELYDQQNQGDEPEGNDDLPF